MHIGVIPARAGSKRFPGKNRALLGGVPLYQRAINLSRSVLDRTIVNSDDLEILHEAPCEKYIRPSHLATDTARVDDVMIEMVKTLKLEQADIIHLIQCTSPFTNADHIRKGMDVLNATSADSVQLVTPIPNTYHAFSQRIIRDNTIQFCYPHDRECCYNSQLKPVNYAFAGYVAFRVESLLKYGSIWGRKSLPIIGSSECAIDIDTPEDLEYAEFVLSKKGAKSC